MDRKVIDLSKVECKVVGFEDMPVGAVEVVGEIFALNKVVRRCKSEEDKLARDYGEAIDRNFKTSRAGACSEVMYLKHEFEVQLENLKNKLWDRYALLIDENGEIVIPMDKEV